MRRIVSLAILAAGFTALAAQADAAPEELGRYELAYPFPSPDGRTLAFQGNFDGRWQLYLLDLGEGAIRRAHVSARDDTHPAFSPDGKRLAFISNRDGNDELYLLDLASGRARSVSPHPGKDGHPKWSADGAWIVFNRTFDPKDVDGDTDSAILRVRPDGSGLETISDSPRIETFASFSPDGRAVAFVEWFPDASGEPARNGEIVTVDLAGKARRNLTNSPEFDGYAYWAPDGWIYFSAAAEGGPEGREAVVFRIRPNGSNRMRVTALDGENEVRAIPDRQGATLYFNRGGNGRTQLFHTPLPAAGESAE